MPKYRDKNILQDLYINQGLSSTEIAKIFSVDRSCILSWIHKFGIKTRSYSEVKLGDKNPNYGKKFSEEHKRKIGEAQTGDKNHMFGKRGELSPIYGRNQSQEVKDKISKANKGLKRSEEIKKEMSTRVKGKNNPMYGKKMPESAKKIISERMRGRKASAETRAKMSKSSSGRNNARWGKSPPASASIGKGGRFTDRKSRTFYMRSSWELAFAVWLDERGYNWDYECKRFDLGFCTYTPDFWVEEMGGWVEIKGYYGKDAQKKTLAFRDLYPEEKLIVATREVLERYPNIEFRRRYAKDAIMSIA